LAASKRDPRLDRGPTAPVADYLDYLDEADRVRALAIGAIEACAVADGRLADDAEHPQQTRQAAWERQQLALAEAANGHPHLNAITLVGMFGNLDGLVEQMVPSAQELILSSLTTSIWAKAVQAVGEVSEDLDDVAAIRIQEAIREVLTDQMPKIRPLGGASPERQERVLRSVGLGAPPGRPLPTSLANALEEVSALRDILVHRAGRVDARAVDKSPRLVSQLGLGVGQFVRIDRRMYRLYSAALRCYGAEVLRRTLMRAGVEMQVNLEGWRDYYYLGA
jgi:hypothetical protein